MDRSGIKVTRSARRTLLVGIDRDLCVYVRAPNTCSDAQIDSFLRAKETWIQTHLQKMQERIANREAVKPFSEQELRELSEKAQAHIPRIAQRYAQMLGLTYGSVTIRKQKTLWGSCSAKGNLSFNCLLMCTPEDVLTYVVVHELCHLKEMNHSSRFWALVSAVLPEYGKQAAWLKENGSRLLYRLR